MNVLDMVCPACFAKAGEPCSAPTSTSRVNMTTQHVARHGALNDAAYNAQDGPWTSHLITFGHTNDNVSRIWRCSCGVNGPETPADQPARVMLSAASHIEDMQAAADRAALTDFQLGLQEGA